MNIEIVYYSRHGSTREIAHNIGKKLGVDTIYDIGKLQDYHRRCGHRGVRYLC